MGAAQAEDFNRDSTSTVLASIGLATIGTVVFAACFFGLLVMGEARTY